MNITNILEEFPPYKPEIYPRKKLSRKNKFGKSELTNDDIDFLVECTAYSAPQVW